MKVLERNILTRDTIPEENKSAGGIILQSKNGYNDITEAEVLSVGSKVEGVNVGDTVLFRATSGTFFERDNLRYRVLDVDSIVAVV